MALHASKLQKICMSQFYTINSSLSCYRHSFTFSSDVIALLDKSLLLKLFYHGHAPPAEALWRFLTQKRLKNGSGKTVPVGLVVLVRPCSCAPHFWKVRTTAVGRKRTHLGTNDHVRRSYTKLWYKEIISILHHSQRAKIVPLHTKCNQSLSSV